MIRMYMEKQVNVMFIKHIRSEKKFPSINDLIEQLNKDKQQIINEWYDWYISFLCCFPIFISFIYEYLGNNKFGDMMLYGWLIFSSFYGYQRSCNEIYVRKHYNIFLAALKVLLSVIAIFVIMKYKNTF